MSVSQEPRRISPSVQSDLPLLYEDFENRAIFRGAKLLQRETSRGVRRASLQQVRRSK
jgi:hypothetical protein